MSHPRVGRHFKLMKVTSEGLRAWGRGAGVASPVTQ